MPTLTIALRRQHVALPLRSRRVFRELRLVRALEHHPEHVHGWQLRRRHADIVLAALALEAAPQVPQHDAAVQRQRGAHEARAHAQLHLKLVEAPQQPEYLLGQSRQETRPRPCVERAVRGLRNGLALLPPSLSLARERLLPADDLGVERRA